MSLFFLESVVLDMGVCGLNDAQVGLVCHRPHARLDTGQEHCLRTVLDNINDHGCGQFWVTVVVVHDF